MKKCKNKDKLKEIHKISGRLDCPPRLVFKDKTKYNRKKKYKGRGEYDNYHPVFIFMSNA